MRASFAGTVVQDILVLGAGKTGGLICGLLADGASLEAHVKKHKPVAVISGLPYFCIPQCGGYRHTGRRAT
jgi:hypothetical protein